MSILNLRGIGELAVSMEEHKDIIEEFAEMIQGVQASLLLSDSQKEFISELLEDELNTTIHARITMKLMTGGAPLIGESL